MLTMILLYGGRFAEGYCVANDLRAGAVAGVRHRQAHHRGQPTAARHRQAHRDTVTFPALGATIIAIASDAASAAGANPTISCFDELWGYTASAVADSGMR